jgi:hypothetical protein
MASLTMPNLKGANANSLTLAALVLGAAGVLVLARKHG